MASRSASAAEGGRARPAWARGAVLFGLALLFLAFVALGTWQVERRSWKLALIERVDARIHAAPVAAPDVDTPRDRLAEDWEYRRVSVTGRYLPGNDTFVQAVTELGAGFWQLTPLARADGSVVIVNRGFVASRPAGAVAPPQTPQTVTGLLRLTEPGGGFLRRNDPAADRWFSRDVEAIAAARRIKQVAPYFVDAAAAPGVATNAFEPVAGLTVVRFPNTHLVYAITWYVLAALSVGAAVPLIREARRPAAAAPLETMR